jgi:hypothetical protein
MNEEQLYTVSANPTIYFYVNVESKQVDYVSMYTIFGITVRPKGEKWRSGSRDELQKYYNEDYEIWSYDWGNEDDTPGSGADLNPENEDEWEILPVQKWAKGEDLSREEISKVCRLVVSPDDYISEEEAAEIPGE